MLTGWNFSDAMAAAVIEKKCPLIGGLDPQLQYMPPSMIQWAAANYGRTFEAIGRLFYNFNCNVIDVIADIVPAVKPQRAFYEAYGPYGDLAFVDTIEYARKAGLIVIEDGKRNDGGDTADAYADGHIGKVPFFGEDDLMAFSRVESPTRADCLTVTPYIGEDCVVRFTKRVKEFGTGIFVVTKTSFKPNSRVENLQVAESCVPVWQKVAGMVSEWGEETEGSCGLRNVGVVMGATYPDDAVAMRKILPNSWLLIPGFGRQGGGAKDAVVGIRQDGLGGVVSNSRGLIYAYADKQGKLLCEPHKCFNMVRQEAINGRDALVAACKEAGKWPH